MRFRGARMYWEIRDLWVGCYWGFDRRGRMWKLTVYLCLIPCLPLRLTWSRP
jgi:hypothetical protein